MSNNQSSIVAQKRNTPATHQAIPNHLELQIQNPSNFQEILGNNPHLEKQLSVFAQMKPKVILITPEIAGQWLEQNTNNRKVDSKTERHYINQMEQGNWLLSHQGIAFDVNEVLQDGQHRLRSIIHSGKPQYMLVFSNMPEENFTILDTAKPRRSSDVLFIAGIKNNTVVISLIADFLLNMIKRNVGRAIHKSAKKESGNTNQLILTLVQKYKDDFEAAAEVTMETYQKKPYLNKRNLGGYYFLFSKFVNPVKAKEFMHLYATGANLPQGHPILLLHDIYEKDAHARKKLPIFDKVALFVKTWNYFITGETQIDKLKFSSKREALPEVLNEEGESIEEHVYVLFPELVPQELSEELETA